MDALHLLSGDAQTFMDKVWASHLHVHRAEPDAFAGLLDLDDVDRLVTSSGMRTPTVRVAKDGEVLSSSGFTRSATLAGVPLTGLIDPRKLLDLFEDGATVVLQGLHRYWPPLADLVRDLELSLGHPCQANAYLTPPGSQGFALHSDTHDVFVFQTHGVKQWEVHDEAGAHDVRLEPGVSMYLPAGTPHAARSQESTSLHVTLGINQVTWHAVVERVTQRLIRDLEDGSLPAGYPQAPDTLTTELTRRLGALSESLAQIDVDAAAQEEADRFWSSRNPHLRGALADRAILATLTDDTSVHRRPGVPCHIVHGEGVLRLLLGDREIRVPERLADPLAFVREQSSLTPADLAPWLDGQSRLVLVRRLVREGLLRVAG